MDELKDEENLDDCMLCDEILLPKDISGEIELHDSKPFFPKKLLQRRKKILGRIKHGKNRHLRTI